MEAALDDINYMRVALGEAQKGQGRTSPNPCVGAVIVSDGGIIGKGFHKRAGTPHAEINALLSANAPVSGATMYVTLEPCSHTGKTPPCCRAVVDAGISRVVVGMLDPNPLVNGQGIKYLVEHGVEVIAPVLEDECKVLNRPFLKFIQNKTPLVIMKAGVSLDGRLNYQKGLSGWITGPESSIAVHTLRDQVDAILVGRSTIEIDNPSLTTRLPGEKRGKDPIRIVLDTRLKSSAQAKVFNVQSESPTWIACSNRIDSSLKKPFEERGCTFIELAESPEGDIDLHKLLVFLGQKNVCSVLVEGGSAIHGSFLKSRLYDRAELFCAPVFAGSHGVPLIGNLYVNDRNSAPRLANVTTTRYGEDVLISGDLHYPEK